jgi:uncharacterized membrane protein SpoIIM required for sporulation
MKWLNKIIEDTLKTSGKWSRKSLTIFVTFIFVILLGTFIVISDKILEKEVNRYAISVFDSLLLFLSVMMGISEASKKIVNKQVPVNEE